MPLERSGSRFSLPATPVFHHRVHLREGAGADAGLHLHAGASVVLHVAADAVNSLEAELLLGRLLCRRGARTAAKLNFERALAFARDAGDRRSELDALEGLRDL